MMTIEELMRICSEAGRRPAAIYSGNSGAVAVAGMEGRIFYAHSGKVVSLFRPEAARNFSNSRNGYFNPGGDGLWPAPEGTCCGYEYAAGTWRVPMGLVNAQYEVTEQTQNHLVMSAEVDLVNNRQLGIPVRFTREVSVMEQKGETIIEQTDGIEYLGTRPLDRGEFLLAPWSLCQFAVTPDSQAVFGAFDGKVRDLYDPSQEYLQRNGTCMELRPNGSHRIQLALPEAAGFLELRLPQERLCIHREGAPLEPLCVGADIADAPTEVEPGEAVRYSIYNDPSGFMELEIVGACRFPLTQGTLLQMRNMTRISDL